MKYLLFLLAFFSLSACSLPWNVGQNGTNDQTGAVSDGTGIEYAQTGQTREERLEEAKRRKSFRSFIRKGDYFSLKNEKEAALRYYLSVYARLRNDDVVERKIGQTYFELKDYQNAFKYFVRVSYVDLADEEKAQFISSLLFSDQIADKKAELKKIPLSSDEQEYYGFVSVCQTNTHDCVTGLQAYTGGYDPIKKLKEPIDTYSKVTVDYQYRNALLSGIFFGAKQYLAAANFAREIVDKRPDYRVAYKMAGYSYYELGRYADAKQMLEKYYSYDPKDTNIAYTLGLVNFMLADYSTSNLYFNTAVINGYTPKTELERRLVYNYYLLGDKQSTFKIFRYLLEEPDVSEDDYVIAVQIATELRDGAKSFLWANKGIEKFPSSDMLYAERGNIYRVRNDLDYALADLNQSITLNPRNANALFGLGALYFAKSEYTLSRQYLQQAIDIDHDGSFGTEASKMLQDVDTAEKASASGSVNGSGAVEATGTVIK